MERLFLGWTIAIGLATYSARVFWNDPLGAKQLYRQLIGHPEAHTTADGWNVTPEGVRWRLEPDQPECPTVTLTPENEALRRYRPMPATPPAKPQDARCPVGGSLPASTTTTVFLCYPPV